MSIGVRWPQIRSWPAATGRSSRVTDWEWIRPRLVLAASAAPGVEASSVTYLFDRDGQAHSAYGLEGIPALVLIRPDGHIAFHGPADSPELLRQYCDNVFAKKGKPADNQ